MSDLEIEIRENGDKHTQPAHVLAGTRRTVISEDCNSVISWIAYRADSRLRPANDRRHYFVTTSLICWAQAQNQPWCYYVRCDHNNVIKWKHFPRYYPFVWGIHGSPVNSPHKGQWRGALMVSLVCTWTNAWVNNRDAGDLRRHRVIVMFRTILKFSGIIDWFDRQII